MPDIGPAIHAISSKGPLKPSRMRSNSTPIWSASVHPALS